jgi:hypothetical protein
VKVLHCLLSCGTVLEVLGKVFNSEGAREDFKTLTTKAFVPRHKVDDRGYPPAICVRVCSARKQALDVCVCVCVCVCACVRV